MNKFESIKELIAGLEKDATKCYVKGNRAAGVRLRKGMLAIQAAAKECRDEVLGLREQK